MWVHCDQPDLLLAYIGGAAGRMIIHTTMLSPELHTWSNDVEAAIEESPTQQTSIKLNYIKTQLFPRHLSKNIQQWKRYEPEPWDTKFEKKKLSIRHCWMRDSKQDIEKYHAKKIAYTDYSNMLDFVLRAAVEKKSYQMVMLPSGKEFGNWYQGSSEQETQELLVKSLCDAVDALARWATYGFHGINLYNFCLAKIDLFVNEYEKLIKYYELTPEIDAAINLRKHWTSIQWQRPALTVQLS